MFFCDVVEQVRRVREVDDVITVGARAWAFVRFHLDAVKYNGFQGAVVGTVCDNVFVAAVSLHRVESRCAVIAIFCLIFSQLGCEVL